MTFEIISYMIADDQKPHYSQLVDSLHRTMSRNFPVGPNNGWRLNVVLESEQILNVKIHARCILHNIWTNAKLVVGKS